MARNIPAAILGMVASAGVSIAGGALLGSYVVTGISPAYAAPPPRIRPDPPLVDEDTWPAPDYAAAISSPGDDQVADGQVAGDQDWGVRASGSSRL